MIAVAVLWIVKPWVPAVELSAPGPTGRRVVEHGLFANYFPVRGTRGAPGVVLLGGSEGGIGSETTREAKALQSQGFSVLTPSYFGAPGQPGQLELIPLETFDRAIAWLRAQPEVDPGRLAIVGASKGAEAALVVATRHPELRAVVAASGSSEVWVGINWNKLKSGSSWTANGKPLPNLPFGPFRWSTLTGKIGHFYVDGLKKRSKYPDAAIPVDRIKAGVLLVCGESDTLWPSCVMSRLDKERAPSIQVLSYPYAGHEIFGPPLASGDAAYRHLARWGGTNAGNNAARAEAWPKIVQFLRTQLLVPTGDQVVTGS